MQDKTIKTINSEGNHSLNQVAKGSVIVFIGTIIGMFFAAIGQVLFARFFSPSEYGIFSLGVTLLSIAVALSTLGLDSGTTRQIAFYMGKNNKTKARSIVQSSIIISGIVGALCSVILYVLSDIIALRIFNMPNLSFPLKVFSIAIPFYVLINILTSVFRGFKSVKEKAYFTDFMKNIFFILFLIAIIVFGLSYQWGVIAYVLSLVLTCMFFIVYYIKKRPIFQQLKKSNVDISIARELLIFSIPLLGVAILQMIIFWTDTLMIGGFKTSAAVGTYNAAHHLAYFIILPMGAMLLIYGPVVSGLYAKNLVNEIRKNYTILTKWVFFLTLPLFIVVFLFPETVLTFLFGMEYVVANQALQILSLGCIFSNLLGPNGTTLIAIGKTKFLMYASLTAAVINIVINIALIPPLGIFGASIATSISLSVYCLIRHIKVHSILKTSPFSKNMIKPSLLFLCLVFLISYILFYFVTIKYWMIPVILLTFYILFFILVVVTNSFDKEDLMMLSLIEKKLKIRIPLLRKILLRFM